MSTNWAFLQNPFNSATRTSYRKMKNIGDFTLAALLAPQPAVTNDFSNLVALLQPLVQSYNTAYLVWLNMQGAQKGQTQSLTDLLNLLRSTQVEDWDLAIQQVYRQHTPQYMALLPRHRVPFQTGSQQDRIAAVGALSLAIGSDPALQTLKAEVDAAYDALTAANNSQKGSKTTKTGSSDAVEAARIALAKGLYGVLGSLMAEYSDNPEEIARFFLLEELRTKEQSIYNQDIKGGETKNVFTRTFEDGEMLKCINRGNPALQIALVHEKNDAMPAEAFTLEAGEEETLPPSALGAPGNRFLIVKSISAKDKGAFTIEIV